jgi:uncharacterized PurR-regulated membrane protein YhhQ (DUF165 family)
VDGLTYHWLRNRAWMVRANGSNMLAAAVDSVVFPTLAWGVLLPWIVLGQWIAKVFGGLLWSYLIVVLYPAKRAAKPSIA